MMTKKKRLLILKRDGSLEKFNPEAYGEEVLRTEGAPSQESVVYESVASVVARMLADVENRGAPAKNARAPILMPVQCRLSFGRAVTSRTGSG
jgi:hypothetical protein